MSLHYSIKDDKIFVRGHTFPHKEKLKALGAQFDREQKIWVLPSTPPTLERLDDLIAQLGGSRIVPTKMNEEPSIEGIPSNGDPREISPIVALSEAQNLGLNEEKENKLQGLSLKELVQFCSVKIAEAFPRPLWIIAEIDNYSIKSSGVFLQLSEDKTKEGSSISLKATLWSRQLTNINQQRQMDIVKDILSEGVKVRMLVQVSLFKDRGQISLQIHDLDPSYTKGALALAREKLLAELRAKGLDVKNKLLKLTAFPLRIGLISSEGSRAYSDFLHQLYHSDQGYCGEVFFVPAMMQGEETTRSVVSALKILGSRVDMIVLTRGGGSTADLRWFDSKDIAVEIANCPIPVIVAVGHHDDRCIAEEVCYHREKTPTAAAGFILSHQSTVYATLLIHFEKMAKLVDQVMKNQRESLDYRGRRLYEVSQQKVMTRMNVLQNKAQNLFVTAFKRVLSFENNINQVQAKMDDLIHQSLSKVQESIFHLERRLIKRDPRGWMEEGWTQLTKNGTKVRSIKQLQLNDEVEARLLDGKLEMIIRKKT